MFSSSASNSTHLFLRSNIHMANLDTALKKHLHLQKFVDVTISCEGRTFKCHRLILAAASPLFESLFIENPSQHPIVIMPLGIKAWTIQALIDFMYKGHINVSQYGLRDLVRSAESLQISGLDSARKDLAKYYQRADVNKEVKVNEHKKLRWKNYKQGNAVIAQSTEQSQQRQLEVEESEDFLEPQPQNDDAHNDNNEDIDDGDNEIFENVAAAVDEAEDEDVFQHYDLTDISYGIQVSTENSNSTNNKSTPCAEMGYAEKHDSEYMFAEEHNDSGLPGSPPTAVLKTKPAKEDFESSRQIGTIRVKSGGKLFDKTNKEFLLSKMNAKTKTQNVSQSLDSCIELTLIPHGIQIESSNIHEQTDHSSASSIPDTLEEYRCGPNNTEGILPYQVKAEQMDLEAENIICQPSVSYLCNTGNVENNIDVGLLSRKLDAHDTPAQYNNSNVPNTLLRAMLTQETTDMYSDEYDDVVGPSLKRNNKLNKHYYTKYATRKSTKTSTAPFSILPSMNCNGVICGKEPSLQTVILRSPRSNQPRSYSNEALYNALMAVKHGESIYRASREHQVPRKTLRNWMKRWDIKSQYPMPKQLKDAATKKKMSENI